MNPDLLLPIVTSIGWLILCCVSLASFRLGWGKMLTMALAWLAIFGGMFLIVEWFMVARGTASALM
jgi:hypothetical protein